MAKRKKKSRRTKREPGVNPQALQIMQRKFGGRRPDPAEAFRTLLREARRVVEKRSDYQLALELAELAEQLARSQDGQRACNALLAEIYFQRGADQRGQARLHDLETAVSLVPGEPQYRIHLAHALEEAGRADEALTHYQAAGEASRDSGVGFLWSLAALEAGQPLPAVNLTPAQEGTLEIVQDLVSGDARSVQLTEAALDGSLPLWRALTQMMADEGAVPIEDLKAAVAALDGTEAAGIVHYYLGVAALRAGDVDAAWRALADARKAGYSSPWLEENLGLLARAQAVQRAEAGDRQGAIDLGEPILRKVEDRILAETVGLAHFHLGYAAAQAGDWQTAVQHWQQAERHVSSRYLAQNLALAREQQEDWEGAAEAWRDMIRRRPRKEDHSDYLDDNQVAGLWRHAAECYGRADNLAEVITCLQNGLKYTPDDVEMRFELSDAMAANEQFEAAENELNHVLEREPENIDALVRLGRLYSTGLHAGYRATEVLEKALDLDPNHEEAREILGTHYIVQGARFMELGLYKLAIEQYRLGLEYLPDYAPLYLHLGIAELRQGNHKAAREHLLQAYDLEPHRARTVGVVLHELLHLDGQKDIERLLPEVREMPGLLPAFWINQGERVLECELDSEWAKRFYDEAVELVGRPRVTETRAEALADIVVNLFDLGEGSGKLGWHYRKRIDQEVPESGAKEYIGGLMAALKEHNWDKAERLLGKARHKARKAGEEGLVEKIELAQRLVFAGPETFYDILGQILG